MLFSSNEVNSIIKGVERYINYVSNEVIVSITIKHGEMKGKERFYLECTIQDIEAYCGGYDHDKYILNAWMDNLGIEIENEDGYSIYNYWEELDLTNKDLAYIRYGIE